MLVDIQPLTASRDMVDATLYDPNAPEDKTILEKIMCGGMIKMYDKIMEDTKS
jgi:hypothetical protein